MRFKTSLFLGCYFAAAVAQADDLAQVYRLALENDPTIQAAHAELVADRQSLPIAIAQMLPNISGNYQTVGTNTNDPYQNSYNTKNYGISLTQPLYHPEHWAQLEQARHIRKGAMAAYLSETQGLIIRVAEQYFAVLSAMDELDYTEAKRKAFARELEQTQQRYEVGLIAITDVQDSKARHDQAVAEEIAAQNLVFDEYERLRAIICIPVQHITQFHLNKPLPLKPPTPSDQESWVNTANKFNLNILTAKEAAEQQKAVISGQVAGHFPKVDIQAQLNRFKGPPPFPFDILEYQRSLTLNVTIPMFSGGSVVYRTKEASARYDKALKDLEAQQRFTDSTVRQSYRGVLTAISSVQALAQVVISNQSSYEATQAAYEVGTRTMVDVLNAQTALLLAKRDHAQSRYNYLLEGLKLKQGAGILSADDLFAVNDVILGKGSASA